MARIFVIDDNPLNLRLLTMVLQNAGHEIEQAADAEQALQQLQHVVPDLFLIDIALPGMDGLTLLRELKADPRFQYLPMVVLTAFAMQSDADRAFASGCDDFVTKPINTRELPKLIDAWLNRSSDTRVGRGGG